MSNYPFPQKMSSKKIILLRGQLHGYAVCFTTAVSHKPHTIRVSFCDVANLYGFEEISQLSWAPLHLKESGK